MTGRRIAAALIASLALDAAHAASILSERDRAVIVAAEHVFSRTGTAALAEAVRSKRIRGEAYWREVYAAAGKPALFEAVRADLIRAAGDIPFVGGSPPPPDVYARAIVFGLGSMPLRPVGLLPADTRRRVLSFAEEALRPYCLEAEKGVAALSAGGDLLADAARAAFRSTSAADGFRRLADAAAALGEPGADLDLIDAKDKLNELLHVYGLHLVIEPGEISRGRAGLKGYVVMAGFRYSIFGTPFSIYEVRPLSPEPQAFRLGHAETELGYLFIFGDQLDAEIEGASAILSGRSRSALWGEEEMLGGISPETADRIEARVRAVVSPLAPRFRSALIDTIAHHEGFHRHIEPSVAAALRTGTLPMSDDGLAHEHGAYLYQIESSGGPMAHWDLLMVLITALNTRGGSVANMEGARAAMAGLQAELPRLRFWDRSSNLPVDAGLVDLFGLSPDQLRKAASAARWSFQARLK